MNSEAEPENSQKCKKEAVLYYLQKESENPCLGMCVASMESNVTSTVIWNHPNNLKFLVLLLE